MHNNPHLYTDYFVSLRSVSYYEPQNFNNMKKQLLGLTLLLLGSVGLVTGQTHTGNVTITGRLGIGAGTPTTIPGSQTFLITDNNIRLHFDDNSSTGNYPANDWEIEINSSQNGGDSYFAIDDETAGNTPFKIMAGAPSHSMHVNANGELGIGTENPAQLIHTLNGNTPALRLEQDGSSGWTPQTWDIAGNETNFFIRDVSNGSSLPFKIMPGAATNTLVLQSSNNIGLMTASPQARLHINVSGSTDNRLVIKDGTTNPSELIVDANGNVGIGVDVPEEKLDVEGAINIGTTTNTNEGTIRWTGTDFEGYKNGVWVSFTSTGTDNQTLSLSGNILTIQNGNTIDLTPVIQPLLDRIDALETEVNSCCGTTLINELGGTDNPVLFQNYPNPFDESTIIEYYLPRGHQGAYLELFTVDGAFVSRIPVKASGQGSVVISKAAMAAGNYVYSLIADGQLIGTKQMTISH